MPTTFQAVLRGDHLEWRDQAPLQLSPDAVVQVQVTILDEPATPVPSQGQRMAATLEQVARLETFAGTDPARWEREIRDDRPLPGREE